jgi:predicted glycosyltransferase
MLHVTGLDPDKGQARTIADPAVATRATPRIVLYSHDTLGFGHLRRNLMIARSLKASTPCPEILMIVGMREAGAFVLPPGVDCVALPAFAKGSDGAYRPRDLGQALEPLVALRSHIIDAAVSAFNPDLMIVDNVPRGALYELDLTLKHLAKRGRTRLVLGLRDVIDSPAEVRRQWLRQRNFEAVRNFYDAVWIYGDPSLYNILEDCGLGGELGGKAHHVGYIDHAARLGSVHAEPDRDAVLGSDPRPYALCAVGGGRDGAALCEAFAAAALPEGHRGILVTGTQMPEASQAVVRALAARRPELTLVEFVREPIALMQGASRIVSMGGYNTVCEVLSLGRPALIVPRVRPRREQVIRAERLAARGLASMLHPDALTPEALGHWMATAKPPAVRKAGALDFSGLERVRALAEAALAEPLPALRAA